MSGGKRVKMFLVTIKDGKFTQTFFDPNTGEVLANVGDPVTKIHRQRAKQLGVRLLEQGG